MARHVANPDETLEYKVTDLQVIEHQYDDDGSHRLVLQTAGSPHDVQGAWTWYQGIATVLDRDGIRYEGATDYFGERVARIYPLTLLNPTEHKLCTVVPDCEEYEGHTGFHTGGRS